VLQALPFALLACACGAAVGGVPAAGDRAGLRRAPLASASSVASAASAGRASSSGGPGAPALSVFGALEARGAALAPGMRVAARKESARGERVEIVRAEGRDACVRVAFESTQPVAAELVDGSGRVLATSKGAATDGMLGERGPVCIRKGDLVAGVASPPGGADGGPFDGGGAAGVGTARVRWVAWEAL